MSAFISLKNNINIENMLGFDPILHLNKTDTFGL